MKKVRFIYQSLALIFVMGLFNACANDNYAEVSANKVFSPKIYKIMNAKNVTLNTCLSVKFENDLKLKNLKTLSEKYFKKYHLKICKKPSIAMLHIKTSTNPKICKTKHKIKVSIDYITPTSAQYDVNTSSYQDCITKNNQLDFKIGSFGSFEYDINWKQNQNNIMDFMISKLSLAIKANKVKIIPKPKN